MKETLNILISTSDYYAPYCGITLTSVFENNREYSFRVFILLGQELSRRNVKRFRELEIRYGCDITFIHVDNSFLKKFELNSIPRLPVETFYKFYAVDLLPKTVDKVLYLDCDIIVNGDISQLWTADLTDKAIAVVHDYLSYVAPNDWSNRLQYPVEAGYFNAGLVLINLDYWRKYDISGKLFGYIEKHHKKLSYMDQDVMNSLLWDKNIYLPVTYNFQLGFLNKSFLQTLPSETKNEVLDTLKSKPAVIHFAGCWKPWSVVFYGLPFRNLWKQYKMISPWSHIIETVPRRKCFNWLIKRYILFPMGIMKPNKDFMQCE